jgi:Uma2 family endonuclease
MNIHPAPYPTSAPAAAPPLIAGQCMSREEFEQRYSAHPEIKHAELIEGVVYVSSPIRIAYHAKPHASMMTWLGVYKAATPGVHLADNGTVRLDANNEPQPDAFLWLEPTAGGQATLSADDYLVGPPELVVEVAASSATYDLGVKRKVYARNGIQEYIVVQTHERRVNWFSLQGREYSTLAPRADGVLCSRVFPGLWLQPAAIWPDDLTTILSVLQQGLAAPEHNAFVKKCRPQMGEAG